ncbi:MAG: hypothetical protein H6852_07620 [Geminicoccaceae bacterium]|jgi:hypothetical protein|nr:hypothetical protein [Geminicoccaceae bacterium]HRY24314.1 hypothetical protein [Geminicoccaceae bacterium]
MSRTGPRTRGLGRLVALGFALLLAACAESRPVPEPPAGRTPAGRAPAGTVELREVQVARPGNAGGGRGTLAYRGRTYPFAIAGLGVDGGDAVDAEGDVYNLHDLADFSGTYTAGQYGAVVGDAGTGDIWLENERKVILHLKAEHEGLRLAVDGAAVDIRLKN